MRGHESRQDLQHPIWKEHTEYEQWYSQWHLSQQATEQFLLWEPFALPAENNQWLEDRIKGFAHVPRASVERFAVLPRRLEGINKL